MSNQKSDIKISNTKCQVSKVKNVQCQHQTSMSYNNIKCRISMSSGNVKYHTSDVTHQMSGINSQMADVKCRPSNVRWQI